MLSCEITLQRFETAVQLFETTVQLSFLCTQDKLT